MALAHKRNNSFLWVYLISEDNINTNKRFSNYETGLL